jgi:hypothetical protein
MPQYDHIQVNTRVELEELTKISIKHGGWLIYSTPKPLPLTIYSNPWRAALFILFALIYFHEAFTYVNPDLSPDPTRAT